MQNRYGAYPRNQRLAILALALGAVCVTLVARSLTTRWNIPDQEVLLTATRLSESLALAEQRDFRPPPESFAFDPNTVSFEELYRLGLSDKQASSWLKFRGNRKDAFRQPEDIGKLFVLSKDDKARLIPLAYVAERAGRTDKKSAPAGFPFDPNVVSERDLQRLGLSPKQAAGFVKYRIKARDGRAFRKVEDLRRLGILSDEQKDHLIALAEIAPPEAEQVRPAQRFPFDPNTISADSFQLLGFPERQARSLLRYRGDRAVTFRRATDLRRVKSLDSALVERVLDLISIALPTPSTAEGLRTEAPAPRSYAYAPRMPPPPPASIDINTADTSQWKTIPGIGSYRAGRIVRFRDALGGFASIDQIRETRGLPDSTFQTMVQYLKASPIPRPLVINRASYEELKRHPYVNRNLANSIVKNREKFGRFNGPEDLRRLRLITEQNLPTLLPYISFE